MTDAADAAAQETQESWQLDQGDPITDELTCMRLLGGGSSYEAYLAFDAITYSPVVTKVVRPHLVTDEDTLRGLRREADLLHELRHPAVVRSLRATADGPRPHLVLEHLDGPRLSTLLRRHGRASAHQYLSMGVEISAALHYFHGRGLIHLDIKPSNLIMGAPTKVIDLSVTRPAEQAANLGYAVGTNGYMAPEQIAGHAVPGSDIWALGAVLYEAISGDRASDIPDRPLLDQVPGSLADLVDACLDDDPAQRPSAAEVADTLSELLERLPRAKLGGLKLTR